MDCLLKTNKNKQDIAGDSGRAPSYLGVLHAGEPGVYADLLLLQRQETLQIGCSTGAPLSAVHQVTVRVVDLRGTRQ